MFKIVLAALFAASSLALVTGSATAAPKCKSGQVYSKTAKKCVAKKKSTTTTTKPSVPRGS